MMPSAHASTIGGLPRPERTMTPSALRVGLIGYGYAGKTFHAPLIAGVPGLVLANQL